MQGVVFRAKSNVLRHRVTLQGLDENASYQFVKGGTKEKAISGKALLAGGLLLPAVKGDDTAFEYYLEKI